MLIIPSILNTPEFTDAELDYKWENDTFIYFYSNVENQKLLNAISQLNYKAIAGFTAALNEWVIWRFYKKTTQVEIDLTKYFKSIESVWAGAINTHYTTDWDLDEVYEDEIPLSDEADTILSGLILSTLLFSSFNKRYRRGVPIIWTNLDKLAMFVRHISPDKTLFDNWLQDRLEKAIKLFPIDYSTFSLADENAIYNTSMDSPIPREFFFTPDFDYQRANVPQLLNQFLQSLNYQNNPYLNSPDKMLEEGFDGTPYHYG